jgi:hypothetical protein
MKMRIGNFAFLASNIGLSNYSKQTESVFCSWKDTSLTELKAEYEKIISMINKKKKKQSSDLSPIVCFVSFGYSSYLKRISLQKINNKKTIKMNFGWFFYFFLTPKSKLLERLLSCHSKRNYSMIPEGGSYNENPNQNEFWLVFLFLPHSQK